LLACLQYLNTSSFDYAWDDKLVITANEYTTRGFDGLADIFTKRVSVPFKSEYRPVPQALHALEYQVFRGSPRAGHAFNILWYALACSLVYAFIRFVFPHLDRLFAFLAAALFAVHPLHVEVVANIKSRDEILALVFGLSSVMLLVKAFETGSWRALLIGAACFVLACLSKSNAVTLLPAVVLVAWYRSEQPRPRRLLVMSLGVATACALVVAAIRYVQSTVTPDASLHLNSTVLNNMFLWSTHSATIVPTALVIIGRYLLLFLYPHPLIHLYGYDQLPLENWANPLPWLVVAGLIGLGVAVARTWRSKPPWIFGVVWFAATYSVYSNLFFYAPDTMADRYMFMPTVGLAIVAVWGVYELAALDPRAPLVTGPRTKAVMTLFGLVLCAYCARTAVGSEDWRNDSTLIHNRIRYMEHNAAAQAIYGQILDRESYRTANGAQRREHKAAAMRAFTAALRIYPDFQAAWIAIGKLFAEQGAYDKAELSFLKAQRLEPLSPDGYFCLGALYMTEHDVDLAVPYLEKAILLDPKMEEAYVLLGKAYLQAGSIDNLGSMTAAAHNWFPRNVALEALRATYYFRKQDYDRAHQVARDVIAREPQNLLALAILSSPLIQDLPRK
jgi:cytochrome c-type biogenesis protein CcmH/NrfG